MCSARIQNLSHIVIASSNVRRMTEFFQEAFNVEAHYSNDEFADFVLPSGARVAFFKPVGKSSKYFSADTARDGISLGVTVKDVNQFYEQCVELAEKYSLSFSGPPKEHPWGEPSFLLIDADGNRWEITQSPSSSGLLVNKE